MLDAGAWLGRAGWDAAIFSGEEELMNTHRALAQCDGIGGRT
jgi:hypothetical protein